MGARKSLIHEKLGHLVLFAAWEFAAQGKRTLIFCTQANWVEGYGKRVVNLCQRGYLDSLLDDEASIARALEVGREWLGDDHPAVACLKAGIAIHHGHLPSPFLRELEILLSDGVLKVIVASPTLSQGLDLNAAVLLVPALYRSGTLITGEEFANVAGRAGRAFVNVEGLIDRYPYPSSLKSQKIPSIHGVLAARVVHKGGIHERLQCCPSLEASQDRRLFCLATETRSDALRLLVGKQEEKRSLKTRDPAEAKRRHLQALTELEKQWENLRAGTRTLSEREAHDLASVAHDRWLEMHRDSRPAKPLVSYRTHRQLSG